MEWREAVKRGEVGGWMHTKDVRGEGGKRICEWMWVLIIGWRRRRRRKKILSRNC